MADVQLVWFKRDLRVTDHRPLVEATRRGPCIFLYIYEPDLLESEDFDPSHLGFVNESLAELNDALEVRGARLTTRRGPAVEVLAALHRAHVFAAIHSHQETGNARTYARDLEVKAWAKRQGLAWHEYRQHGVVRGLRDRDGWAAQWKQLMSEPAFAAPERWPNVNGVPSDGIRTSTDLGLDRCRPMTRQSGGEAEATAILRSFLKARGQNYQQDMSSPGAGEASCSRLSAHLAYGTISVRTVYQALRRRREDLKRRRSRDGWAASMSSFEKRLHWHCHFIQKLESEPRLEFENMARAYDGLREDDFDDERFQRWKAGRTGYPMVDACMRYLYATGWLNFRMRAMVVSFAAYHLWLHWRPVGVHLARQFLDYEPGIHFSQLQMQSGTTGINAVRIYSPIKQVADQDPEGVFIRRWVPELEGVPAEHIAQPHLMSLDDQHRFGCIIGGDYPPPIVDHKEAVAEAKRKIHSVRTLRSSRMQAQDVFQKHGSRRRPTSRRARRG